MPVSSLIPSQHLDFVQSYEYNNTPIRLEVYEHFSRKEIEAYSDRSYQYNYQSVPLDVLETPSKITNRNLRSYAYSLAFSRRNTFPLSEAIHIPISYKHYPIEQLYNFQYLDEIFEKYYPSFSKIDSNNTGKKEIFKKQVTQLVFKLWLCGYGLLPKITGKCLNDEVIEELRDYTRTKSFTVKVVRFLSYALCQEERSNVTTLHTVKIVTPLAEREQGKWKAVTDLYKTEITEELHNFCFKNIKSRIGKDTFFEYTDEKGNLLRESLGSITDSTWVQYSLATLDLCELLNSNGYFTIEECINKGLHYVMTNFVSKLSKGSKSNIRIVAKNWLNYYTKKNSINININRIVPPVIHNNGKTFGKVFDFGAAITLIETLLDENSGYFDETILMDYRCRRSCLLELATGQRITSICYILKDCIKYDSMDTPWILFHKTKHHRSNKVVATPDILKWVEELKSVAPEQKIFISPKEYEYGDNIEDYRLFANKFNDGPLTTPVVNSFLYRIQEKIWQDKHPNKKPFSSHDLRRMHAVYMKLNGRSETDIKEQLGQGDIKSQIPYLQTKPVAHQKHFKDIQQKGVYNIVGDDAVIYPDNIIDIVAKLNDDRFDAKKITQILLDASNDVADFEVPEPQTSPLPTGFPMRVNSCNATMLTNCGHTELHCFKCSHYKPEVNSLDDHKTEIFRYMVLVIFQDKSLKKTKDLLERDVITFRSSELNSLIDECFANLFSKFEISTDKALDIKKDLSDKATRYIKKHMKNNPNPSFVQAKNFLLVGDING